MFLRDNLILRKTFYPFVRWLMVDVLKYRLHAMRKYGYVAVAKIQKSSNSVGISCFPMFGTLLGFVRDGGFISHDNDMDFMICEEAGLEKFYHLLLNEGFTFGRYILFDGKFKEFTMRYKECSIDFFGCGDAIGDNMIKVHTENYGDFWGALEFPKPCDPQPYEVHGVETVLPRNYEEILRLNYGDYHKKIANWNSTMAPAFRKDNDGHLVKISFDESEWKHWLKYRPHAN